MSNDTNVIELNGSQYDALTGGMIASPIQTPVRQSPYQNASQSAPQQNQQSYNEQRLYSHTTQPAHPYGQPQSAPAIIQPAQLMQPQQAVQQPVAQPQFIQQVAVATPVAAPVITAPTPIAPVQVAAPVSMIPAERLSAAPVLPEVPHVPVVEQATTAAKAAITRKAAQHAKRHKPQSTRTLMRHAVKAPAVSHKPHSSQTQKSTTSLKAHSSPMHHKPDVSVTTSVSHVHRTATKSPVHHAQAARYQRAQATIQSDMIDRFRKQSMPREVAAKTASTASPLIPAADKPVVAESVTRVAAPVQPQQSVTTNNGFFDDRNDQTSKLDQQEQRLWPSADRYRADSPTDLDDSYDFNTNLDEELPTHFGTQPLAKTSAFESGVFEPRAVASTTPATSSQVQTQTQTQASPTRNTETSAPLQAMRQDKQEVQSKPVEPTSKFAKAPVKEDIFERALAVASNHQQQDASPQSKMQATKRVKKPKRVMRWAASVAVLLLIIGFVAIQNRTAIQLQLASAKAGFAASAPGFTPSGFAMARISYSPGTVSANYEHNDKAFTVIQKKTTWDSQALLENFVATSNEPYQGYDSKGRTIYVYGSGRATWVNNGVWYQVHADNVLSNEQLVKIASSM